MANTVKNGDIDIDKFVKNVVDLSNLGRLHLIDFDTKPIGVNDLNKLADIHSINNEDGESTVAWYLSKLGLHYQDVVDFTDMIMFPNIMNLSTDVYDYVFIDECQDLNTCQRLLMEKAIKPDTGRFIAVGDPKQAIYAFAGADYESYQKLKKIPNTIELPLSVTYRCAEPIVKWVKHLNPLIKHFSKNKTGVVHETFSYKDIQDGDMVLCRNTFPIVALCIKLLSEGKKSYIIGSDIGMSLILMIENCEKKTEDFTMINVFSRLYHDKDKLIEKVMSNHKMIKSEAMEDSQVIIMNEKIQAIEVLSEGISNPHDVIRKIKELFSNDKKSGICLSNMHKSKGLESERVFIIHQELIPSKYAKLQWQIEQERNLEYVAYTRAKTTLGFVNDFDAFKSYKSQSENVVKVSESKHIGSPKMKMKFELKVVDKRNFKGPYGDTIIYEMVDKNGNLFSKFGDISEDFLLGTDDKVEVNSRVSFYGIIKSHSEFKGNKITNLGKITQY
jgi:superfamily I DNA/RNA helicase